MGDKKKRCETTRAQRGAAKKTDAQTGGRSKRDGWDEVLENLNMRTERYGGSNSEGRDQQEAAELELSEVRTCKQPEASSLNTDVSPDTPQKNVSAAVRRVQLTQCICCTD